MICQVLIIIALVWEIHVLFRRYTDLRTYFIDAHQFSDIRILGIEMIEDIPYLAIQLTQEQKKHPIL